MTKNEQNEIVLNVNHNFFIRETIVTICSAIIALIGYPIITAVIISLSFVFNLITTDTDMTNLIIAASALVVLAFLVTVIALNFRLISRHKQITSNEIKLVSDLE